MGWCKPSSPLGCSAPHVRLLFRFDCLIKGSFTLATVVCRFCSRLHQHRDRNFSISLHQCNHLPHTAASNAAVWLSLKHSLSRCNYDLYTIDTWDSSSAAEPKMTQNLFFKWVILGLFFAFVWTFQFLQQYNVKKCPSSIWTHDLWNASLLPKPLIRTSFCKTFLFVRVGIFSLENSGILLASYRSKRRKVSDKLKENNLPFSH